MIRLFALLLLLTLPAHAATGPSERMGDPVLETRAQALYDRFRCVMCQSQSIRDSDADVAQDLRALIRDRLTAGDSDAAITEYIHSRYGDAVLMQPPVRPATWLLWFGPFLVLAAGGLLALRQFGTMR